MCYYIDMTGSIRHIVFNVHTYFNMSYNFICFYCWIIFHCVDIPQIIYSFINWVVSILATWMLLPWTFMYTFLCGHRFSVFWDKCSQVRLLVFMANACMVLIFKNFYQNNLYIMLNKFKVYSVLIWYIYILQIWLPQ